MVYKSVSKPSHYVRHIRTYSVIPCSQYQLSPREMWRLKICTLLTAPTHLPNRVNHCIIWVEHLQNDLVIEIWHTEHHSYFGIMYSNTVYMCVLYIYLHMCCVHRACVRSCVCACVRVSLCVVLRVKVCALNVIVLNASLWLSCEHSYSTERSRWVMPLLELFVILILKAPQRENLFTQLREVITY